MSLVDSKSLPTVGDLNVFVQQLSDWAIFNADDGYFDPDEGNPYEQIVWVLEPKGINRYFMDRFTNDLFFHDFACDTVVIPPVKDSTWGGYCSILYEEYIEDSYVDDYSVTLGNSTKNFLPHNTIFIQSNGLILKYNLEWAKKLLPYDATVFGLPEESRFGVADATICYFSWAIGHDGIGDNIFTI